MEYIYCECWNDNTSHNHHGTANPISNREIVSLKGMVGIDSKYEIDKYELFLKNPYIKERKNEL